MGKTKPITDIGSNLKDLEAIFQKNRFAILSFLYKRRLNPASFSELRDELKLNPNALSRHLNRLMEADLVVNEFVTPSETVKDFSFYNISKWGESILSRLLGVPMVSELVDKFKEHCESKGWKSIESTDLIQTKDGKYHAFLWCNDITPEKFVKAIEKHRCKVTTENSFQELNIDYIAWLFLDISPKRLNELIKLLMQEPDNIKRIAVYDLSKAYVLGPKVVKLNKTHSEVFQDFEHFFDTRWKVDMVDMELHAMENSNYFLPKSRRKS